MSYANPPIMQATMFGRTPRFRGAIAGLGELPASARPIADLSRSYGSTYDIDTAGLPRTATHFRITGVESDHILYDLFDRTGTVVGAGVAFARAGHTAPDPEPASTPAPSSGGIVQKATELLQRVTGKPAGTTTTPGAGKPSAMLMPYGPTTPTPYGYPPSTLYTAPPTTGEVPEWLLPVALIGAVGIVAAGIYYATKKRPRVAANPRKRRTSRQRKARRRRPLRWAAYGRPVHSRKKARVLSRHRTYLAAERAAVKALDSGRYSAVYADLAPGHGPGGYRVEVAAARARG